MEKWYTRYLQEKNMYCKETHLMGHFSPTAPENSNFLAKAPQASTIFNPMRRLIMSMHQISPNHDKTMKEK